MPTNKPRHSIAAQVPLELWAKLQPVRDAFPGLSGNALIKMALSLAAESDPETLGKHAGRF